MRKSITKIWSDEDIARWSRMIDAGASISRCSVALDCPTSSVRIQARKMGKPFPDIRLVKARQRTKIAEAERNLPPGSWRYDGTMR